jgi:hypothetical protein
MPAKLDEFFDYTGAMPRVEGCKKQDYAVLFVIAVAVKAEGR